MAPRRLPSQDASPACSSLSSALAEPSPTASSSSPLTVAVLSSLYLCMTAAAGRPSSSSSVGAAPHCTPWTSACLSTCTTTTSLQSAQSKATTPGAVLPCFAFKAVSSSRGTGFVLSRARPLGRASKMSPW
uniref:Uncharacterized protein n=1 Tax=Triticum urartu TaxID=4572 RepID=A0A8R7Q0X1_TRIUA